MTWRARWQELKRIYGSGRRPEIRSTAIGWNPGGCIENINPPSGVPEYYTVLREGATQPEPAAEPQTLTTLKKVMEAKS